MEDTIITVAKLAEEAGEAIMTIYGKEDFSVTQKEDRSPLTEADMAAHTIIMEGLGFLDPPRPVLSEESEAAPFEIRSQWNQYWLVDPLDGTKEFIKRNGEFTVNIALIENGRPVAGVVFAPALNVTYYASKSGGAWKRKINQAPEKIEVTPFVDGVLKIVASRSHRGVEVDNFLGKLDQPYELVNCGSSLKLCLVAEGRAHLYPRLAPTMEWDIAAAHIIVEEAGGTVTDLNGGPLIYNKENLLNPFFIVSAPLSFTLPI